MAELNPNIIVVGMKHEATRGTAETLVDADYNVGFVDVEMVKYASDHAPVGKAANGKLINTGRSYSRSRGATSEIKAEIKRTDTPTVKPNYFKVLESAGMKTGVIEAGVNDNYEAYYDGRPSCVSATFISNVFGCDSNGYVLGLAGAVISDLKLTIEGPGAPLVMSGTISGKLFSTTLTAVEPVATKDAGNCVLGTGMVGTRGGVVVNWTKFEWSSNLGASVVTNMGDQYDTNISHYNLADGGDPTMTDSFIPLSDNADDGWADLFGNTVDDEMTFENDDMKIIVENPQFTDLQDGNESGVLVREQTNKCGGIRLQLK